MFNYIVVCSFVMNALVIIAAVWFYVQGQREVTNLNPDMAMLGLEDRITTLESKMNAVTLRLGLVPQGSGKL